MLKQNAVVTSIHVAAVVLAQIFLNIQYLTDVRKVFNDLILVSSVKFIKSSQEQSI